MADTKICILAVYKALLDAEDKLSLYDLMRMCERDYNSEYNRKSLTDTLNVIEIIDTRLRKQEGNAFQKKKKNLYWIEK